MRHTVTAVLLCTLLLLPAASWGWGNGTHVYFVSRLEAHRGGILAHDVWGAVLTDAFNYVLNPPGQFMADQLHHNPAAFADDARGCALVSTGFGLVSHNDTWGADYTAHHDSRLVPGTGYAILKGAALAPALIPSIAQILVDAGLDAGTAGAIAAALAPEFGHDLAETAVDILLKRNIDPAIGARLAHAARTRPGVVPQAMVNTWAGPLAAFAGFTRADAAAFIRAAEEAHRAQIVQYGAALALPAPQDLQVLAYMSAGAAELFLETAAGVDVTVSPATAGGFLQSAVDLVDDDFAAEIAGTLAYLSEAMTAHGAASCGGRPLARADAETPAGVRLLGNYPNPFNPSTEIVFTLPEGMEVDLTVYTMLGQAVRRLTGGSVRDAGRHAVVWDGKDDGGAPLPSGTYLYRLATPRGTLTGKMTLVK